MRDTLRSLDAAIHGAFLGAGMAGVGEYFARDAAPDADGVPVRLYLDRGVDVFGEFGQVVGRRDELVLLMADVAPAKGAHIVTEGMRFELVEKIDQDDGTARWVVREEPLP